MAHVTLTLIWHHSPPLLVCAMEAMQAMKAPTKAMKATQEPTKTMKAMKAPTKAMKATKAPYIIYGYNLKALTKATKAMKAMIRDRNVMDLRACALSALDYANHFDIDGAPPNSMFPILEELRLICNLANLQTRCLRFWPCLMARVWRGRGSR